MIGYNYKKLLRKGGLIIINFNDCYVTSLTSDYVKEISCWSYELIYDEYSFFNRNNGYLLDESTWGIEQFCMMYNEEVIAQIACQIEENIMWVGWSLKPTLCGQGYGKKFIEKCINEIVRIKSYKNGYIYLRVAEWNKRAIKCYERVGFQYQETILDEIAGSNNLVEFWIMRKLVI